MRRPILALLLALTALPAAAQPAHCRLPERVSVAACDSRARDGDAAAARGSPGAFDFYVLALSWSPAFCEQARNRAATDLQCRRNRFGFVVHGLWPQYGPGRGSGWPQFCAPTPPVPEAALRRALCLMPGERLVQCQWAKHGTCSDQPTPDAYIDAVQRLMGTLALPDFGTGGSRTVGEIADAFVAANRAKGLTTAHLRVDLTRDGKLEEVRLCYEKPLDRFRPCGETVGGFDPADGRDRGRRVLIRAMAPS